MPVSERFSQLRDQYPKSILAISMLIAASPALAGAILTILSQTRPSGELFGHCNPDVFDMLEHAAPGVRMDIIRKNCEPYGYCGGSISNVNATFADQLCAEQCHSAYLFTDSVFRLCSSNAMGGAAGFLILAGAFTLCTAFTYFICKGTVSRAADDIANLPRQVIACLQSLFHQEATSSSRFSEGSVEGSVEEGFLPDTNGRYGTSTFGR